MNLPNVWRDLEARFRTLQPAHASGLRAEWYGISKTWMLSDPPSATTLRRFESAAVRAAKVKGSQALGDWLTFLKAESLRTKSNEYHVDSVSSHKIGKERKRRGENGSIERVCEVSANYCERLADELDSEHGRGSDREAAQEHKDPGDQYCPVESMELSDREKNIFTIIDRGARGLMYCRELDKAGVRPVRTGVWKDCARSYEAAYKLGAPWPHRIQDEKYKIAKKATRTRTR
jgi:hypothetical protein